MKIKGYKIFIIGLLASLIVIVSSLYLIGNQFLLKNEFTYHLTKEIIIISMFILLLGTLTVCCWFKSRKIKVNEENVIRLAKVNEDKNRLINILSHDIRQPIKTFETILNAVQKGYVNNTEFDKYSNYVKNQLMPVQLMVDELLFWSTDQLNGLKSNPTVINLEKEINEILIQLEQSYILKNIKIYKNFEGKVAFSDLNHFKIIIRNIIHNSIKYSPPGSTIQLDINEKTNSTTLTVSDQGKGMSDDQIFQILNQEMSLDRAGTLGEEGMGIGLTFCVHLLRMNKGSIEINSEINKGTTITIDFPNSH
ncbi:HAMP domain-containing sensor histidine kinase [Mangrovivirga sp. M17]|uniref:histidine kinase n=1 Tax=Mangrovivirga halotolerans TaxID=2993936 RepID=A0ABT3RPU2_9BACT|nr:HAMP domain-containing sensor histidine kinase [Mangrovivirga halotolerans]MCX2743813.1 HAMP domain-containing sensor histidine kinase [Mangrovivirga halotolerans]